MTTKCILCNEPDGVCLVLSDCQSFHCTMCNDSFTVEDVEERVREMRKLICVSRAAKAAAEKE